MIIKTPGTTRGGLTRRTLLRGLLGSAAVTVGLPPLERFFNESGTAYAATCEALPRRFGLFFWANGSLPEFWVPPDTGAGFTLPPLLEPMAALREKISVVSGTKVLTGNPVAHWSGAGGFLTGAPLITRGGEEYTFAAPTLDQVIANEVGSATRFRSLEVGIERGQPPISYSGPDAGNPSETSPAALFDRVFGGGFVAPGEQVEADPKLRLRRSVLDAVMGDAARLKARLGAGDQRRLDQHLTGIRDLERRIARLQEAPPDLAACVRPEAPLAAYPDEAGRPQLQAINRAMADLMALTLACDQTRVFSYQFHRPVSNALFPGASMGHHQLTHDEAGSQPEVKAILLQIMGELSYLLGALDAVQEGDGTLLDHMVVLATSDCSRGRTHTLEDYPILLAGSCCGELRTGVHYRSPSSENASRVPMTLARAMGLRPLTFGAAEGEVSEGLSAIEAG